MLLLAAAGLMLIGCGMPMISSMGNGGVAPAMIMTDVNYPAKGAGNANFNIDCTTKYKIVGVVNTESQSSNILGIIAQGDNGYRLLQDKAKAMGADDVINVTTDIKYNYYFFGVFQKVTGYTSGLAIKYEYDNSYPQAARPVYTPQPAPVYTPAPAPQPTVRSIDKNKLYFVMINGQKYGPISIKYIQDLKSMGYCDDNSDAIDPDNNATYKVSDLLR